MRKRYDEALNQIHQELIKMGSLCEEGIDLALRIMFSENNEVLDKINYIEKRINEQERLIEDLCMRVILLEQPVANDLKQISVALKMITDLERIGDQALDIASLPVFPSFSMETHLEEMGMLCNKMVKGAITAFIQNDLHLSKEIIKMDDIVDDLFLQIKEEVTRLIREDGDHALDILNLLMAAKYFERIADHSVNIAECV